VPTYRVVVEYDGTEFAGLQYQPALRTVAGELEGALSALFAEPLKIAAAGRTDAGVHATGQVISFSSARAFPADRLAYALNAGLPADLTVRDAALVPDGFSARFDALARTYVYRILNRPFPSAPARRYAHHVWSPIDDGLLRRAAADLIGEHDFVAFCGVLPDRGGTVRRVEEVELRRAGERVALRIRGAGFLHRMVRILSGTLIEIGTGRRDPGDIPRILASRDRRQAGYTAPACGLTLAGVRYPGFDSELAEPQITSR
jgi:tRNA pseudouridine38-40 synthase